MREVGYDFYGNKVLDEAFKSGVKILNRMAGGRDSPSSFGMSDEIYFDDDEYYGDGDQLLDSLKC
jgi:hypothetical protein